MDAVEITIVVGGLALFGGLGLLGWRGLGRSLAEDALWATGVPVEARIVSVRRTGARSGRESNGSREVEITLALEASGAERTVRFFPAREAEPLLVEGARLDVRVAADDDRRVAIDPAMRAA